MLANSLLFFAKTLAGKFSNFDQAQSRPKDFAHINIYFIPLKWSLLKGPWFYSEQSYDYAPWSPYRQSLHKLKVLGDIFIVENYKLLNPERLAGSGFTPELLNSIKEDSITPRVGCAMYFKEFSHGHYVGGVEPGNLCSVKRAGKITYLVSKVEFNDSSFISLDEGYDKDTHEKVWGSNYGKLYFKKVINFRERLDQDWQELLT